VFRLDKVMVSWYHGTMNVIATNLRFPTDEYGQIKLLALAEGKSIAALVREAVRRYKEQKLTSRFQVDLAEKFRKMAVKIDVPVTELVRQGRKFE